MVLLFVVVATQKRMISTELRAGVNTMTVHNTKMQCSWASGIDFNGLNKEDRQRITRVGFLTWLDEIAAPKSKLLTVPAKIQIGTQKITYSAKQVIPTTQTKIAPTISVTPEAKIIQTQATNKVKPTSVGYPLAMEFIRLAKENKDIVTYEQCEKLCPAYPTDPASWARAMGLQIQTEKKEKRYKVIKYV